MILFLISFFLSNAHADVFGGGQTDYLGNGLTSQINGSQQALDVGVNVSGVQIDPRDRNWFLSSGSDSISCTQGTSPWLTSRSWDLDFSNDQVDVTGSTVTALQGTSPWLTSRNWALSSGTDSVTSIQGTTPWVSNVSQFGSNAVVTGTGTSGVGIPRVTVASDSSITANAGTNLNTSALNLESTQTAFKSANHTDLVAINTAQTDGTQKTKQVDALGNVQPAGDTNARGVHTIPGDGTNAQSYTTQGEAKVLGRSEPQTNSRNEAAYAITINQINGQATETDLLSISNPNGSGKTVRLYSIANWVFPNSNNWCVFRYYRGSSGISGGATVTPSNLTSGSSNTSVLSVKSLPTVTTRGTTLASRAGPAGNTQGSIYTGELLQGYWSIPANSAMVVTAECKANNVPTMVTLEEFEE